MGQFLFISTVSDFDCFVKFSLLKFCLTLSLKFWSGAEFQYVSVFFKPGIFLLSRRMTFWHPFTMPEKWEQNILTCDLSIFSGSNIGNQLWGERVATCLLSSSRGRNSDSQPGKEHGLLDWGEIQVRLTRKRNQIFSCLRQIWGFLFRATLHRVVDKTYGLKERYSVPFFYETNIDTVIEPLVEDCQEVRDYIAKNFEGKKSICAAGMVIDKRLFSLFCKECAKKAESSLQTLALTRAYAELEQTEW